MTEITKSEKLLRSLAPVMTGTKGADAYNRFAKLAVVGALKDKGFEDGRNSDLAELYKKAYVCAGNFNLLVRFSFLNAVGSFIWDFASGVSVGKSMGEKTYASSKGRYSKWVGKGAEKNWRDLNITGMVLVGLDGNDEIRFYYVGREEFLDLGKDRLIVKPNGRPEWEEAWSNLQFEQTFSSVL